MLVRLQAAGHTEFIDVAAAVSQAAFTQVLPRAGGVHITATIHEQILPLADITQLIREQCLALDGVPALGDLAAAVAQVEADFPWDAVVRVSRLKKSAVPYDPLLLF